MGGVLELKSDFLFETSQTRGRQFCFRRTPRAFAKSQTHPPTCRFFYVRFGAFLGKGSSKTPQKHFCKKALSKTFGKKNDKISMSDFL
jgi:hypothetical protein